MPGQEKSRPARDGSSNTTTVSRVPRWLAVQLRALLAQDTNQQVLCPDCGTTRDHADTCPIGRGIRVGRADDAQWFAVHGMGATRHRSPFPQERNEFGVAFHPRHGVLVTVKMLHPGVRQRAFGGVHCTEFAPELVAAMGGWPA